ncbi:hypothetical protein M011DRAFT_465544 [Sporormia fimetaria CBS 119925]|uniref:MAPEG-domain-containing protein n=1 Tax=Sporormia fimetaria CBS 119925 TaxID=1340428 RepID=A0A6A6VJ94_9PLEO|nr:hypothetical protein M011DRAFT_465544 [Sporormia fimetaria CBS 119925]
MDQNYSLYGIAMYFVLFCMVPKLYGAVLTDTKTPTEQNPGAAANFMWKKRLDDYYDFSLREFPLFTAAVILGTIHAYSDAHISELNVVTGVALAVRVCDMVCYFYAQGNTSSKDRLYCWFLSNAASLYLVTKAAAGLQNRIICRI